MKFGASRQQRRAMNRALQSANRAWPAELIEIPREEWPASQEAQRPIRAFRSREFFVQIYTAPGDVLRLSANRAALGPDGRWVDGITWDDLQRLKREAGYGDSFAVEIYPADHDIVNVGNLGHLWILPPDRTPPYAWRRP